jgi:DNA sulfur modification protein DndE
MGSTEVNDNYREMRYVLMIDEAHDLFREKKSLEILEVILRKIRSYGVSVFLLSQGIAEYNTANFDFSQECETSFLLPINDMANTKAINKFLGLTIRDGNTAIRNLEKLSNGQAVSNVKEYQRTEVFDVVQYWKESL